MKKTFLLFSLAILFTVFAGCKSDDNSELQASNQTLGKPTPSPNILTLYSDINSEGATKQINFYNSDDNTKRQEKSLNLTGSFNDRLSSFKLTQDLITNPNTYLYVTLYEHNDLKGRALSFYCTGGCENFAVTNLIDFGFNDITSSVKLTWGPKLP